MKFENYDQGFDIKEDSMKVRNADLKTSDRHGGETFGRILQPRTHAFGQGNLV